MKTMLAKTDWIMAGLGIVVVAGALMLTRNYAKLEGWAGDLENQDRVVTGLYRDHELTMALKQIRQGDVKDATRRLEALVCNDVLRLNEELNSVDAGTRLFIENGFRRMAMARSPVEGQVVTETQAAADRILSGFLKAPQTAQFVR